MRTSIVLVLVLNAFLAFANESNDYNSTVQLQPQSDDDKTIFESCKNNDCNSTAWESSGQKEGDIIIPDGLKVNSRYGSSNLGIRWPNAKVYFSVDSELTEREKYIVYHGMAYIMSKTCVKFELKTNQPGYVNITSHLPGCEATLGYTGNVQTLNLNSNGCMSVQVAMHELMHSLGFIHEQNGFNRDDYVTINLENVQTDKEFNFKKDESSINFGLAYDYKSIMHYGRKAFSVNKEDTIVTKDPEFMDVIGNSWTLSPTDVKRINLMYQCR